MRDHESHCHGLSGRDRVPTTRSPHVGESDLRLPHGYVHAHVRDCAHERAHAHGCDCAEYHHYECVDGRAGVNVDAHGHGYAGACLPLSSSP